MGLGLSTSFSEFIWYYFFGLFTDSLGGHEMNKENKEIENNSSMPLLASKALFFLHSSTHRVLECAIHTQSACYIPESDQCATCVKENVTLL